MTPPSFAQHLTAWKESVAGQKHPPLPLEIVATTLDEFQNWQAQLQATKIEAGKHGYPCQFNRSGKGARMAAWITSGGFTLKIAFTAKAKRPQAVTQTSRDAYKTVDTADKCESVARAAIKLGVCTDNEVGREIGMPANLVSGRRNNIEDAGGITIDGVFYVVKMSGVAKRDPITKRSGNVWFLEGAVKIEKVEPSQESPKQTELF